MSFGGGSKPGNGNPFGESQFSLPYKLDDETTTFLTDKKRISLFNTISNFGNQRPAMLFDGFFPP